MWQFMSEHPVCSFLLAFFVVGPCVCAVTRSVTGVFSRRPVVNIDNITLDRVGEVHTSKASDIKVS